MRLKAKSKVIALIAIMLASAWLYSSTIRIDVTNVYHNKGNITIRILDQGQMGSSYTRYFPPTVYCCGTQTIYWEDFQLQSGTIYVEATQDGRSANQSGITIEPWPSVTYVYLTLPAIPNFPHKNERK
jgi:hypothetical protein